MGLFVGLGPAALGVLLLRALGSGAFRFCRHEAFRLLLGTGIGIGVCSECYFAGLVSGISGFLLEPLLLFAAGVVIALNRNQARCCFCETPKSREEDRFLTGVLAFTFFVLISSDLAVFSWVSARTPRGGWDAWAIWNLRAHFLFRSGGIAWRDAFTEVLDWSHPDYPLLLPAFVARGWNLLGRDTNAVPIALAGFFAFGTVGLMALSLGILRGIRQGLMAGIALAATPFLYVQGAMQCADIPVAFYRLATLAALAIADRFDSRGFAVVAGMAAALGGWAKNEGLLWFFAILLARIIISRSRLFPEFMAGSLPILAPIIVFKARFATPSDIFGTAGRVGMKARAMDPLRYILILREALWHVWNFGPLLISAFAILAVYVVVTGLCPGKRDRAILQASLIAILFTTAGYFMIYLLRPLDLRWLLDTSGDRLLLQLWPAIVFVIFLGCRAPARVFISRTRGELSSRPAPMDRAFDLSAVATRSSEPGFHRRSVPESVDAGRCGIF